MKQVLSFVIAVGLAVSTMAHADELSIVLVGDREPVLQLVAKSLDAEFSGGTRVRASESVGYRVNFPSFWTGPSELIVSMSPMGKGDSIEVDGYGMFFQWSAQRGDARQHAVALVNQIVQQANSQSAVRIDKDFSSYKPLREQSSKCYGRLKDDPDLKPIAEKLGLAGADTQTFAMLANEANPTEEERKLIMLWATKRDGCAKGTRLVANFFPNHPMIPIELGLVDASDQLVLGLYRGAFNYGQFAKLRSDLSKQYADAYRKVVAETKAKDAEANERARRASLEAARIMLEEQRINIERYRVQQPPQPIEVVVPSRQTNCVTTRNGNSLQTQCN